MKNSDLQKLRDKSAEDLRGMVTELRDTMLKARIARSMEGKQAGMGYRSARRQIARIQTILTQKGASAPAPAPKAAAAAPAPKAEKKAAAPKAEKAEKKTAEKAAKPAGKKA
jgi:ribosomal protein L29